MNATTLIRGHPLVAYFVLAYTIPWLGSLAAVGPKQMRGEAMLPVDSMVVLLLMLAGPSVAGITMTTVMDGNAGLRNLFARMCKWRVGARWYAALLIPPALILAVLLVLSSAVSPIFTPGGSWAFGIMAGLLAGFLEEIGWTGYAFPRMRLAHSALAAALSLGLIHTAWHLMGDYLITSAPDGVLWLPHFLAWMVVPMLAMRVLISWLYCNTGSVLLAQLMHASSTGFLVVLSPSPATPATEITWYTAYAVLLWILVAVVVAVFGKQLVRSEHGDRALPMARSAG